MRKIRVILAEKNLPYELLKESPWEAGNHVADYNPLVKVPALMSDTGEVFFHSPVIADYVDSLSPSPAFLPNDRQAAIRVRQLEALADGVCDAGIAIFLEGRRPAEKQWTDWVARQEDKVRRGCDALERAITGHAYLAGEQMSVADVSAACTLAWLDFRLAHLAWREARPNLTAHIEKLLARPSFQATVPMV